MEEQSPVDKFYEWLAALKRMVLKNVAEESQQKICILPI